MHRKEEILKERDSFEDIGTDRRTISE